MNRIQTLLFFGIDPNNLKTRPKVETPAVCAKPVVHVDENKANTQTFPTLHCKERVWNVWVSENIVFHSYGIENGKFQTVEREYGFTNQGKSNEMSPHETAKSKAERDWFSQLEKGYKPYDTDIDGMAQYHKCLAEKEKNGGANYSEKRGGKRQINMDNGKLPTIKLNVYPMLCQEWCSKTHGLEKNSDYDNKNFPYEIGFYIEPKYDGVRCVARVQDGKVILTSRSNKQFPWLSTLRSQILAFLEKYPMAVLDGELYAHELYDDNNQPIDKNDKFNVISEICSMSRKTPHKWEEQLCYHVFDIVDFDGINTQKERNMVLEKLFKPNKSVTDLGSDNSVINSTEVIIDKLFLSPKTFIQSKLEMQKEYEKILEGGYEGVIVRRADLLYGDGKKQVELKNTRSHYMCKKKPFMDEEFKVIGFNSGASPEYYSWRCITKYGSEFNVDATGTKALRIRNNTNQAEIIGKMATVTFQDYTDAPEKMGVPRFGKFIRVREGKDI